jgi:class 3 adenylate cyclase/tetratricopeptide (TPR) repeat protein
VCGTVNAEEARFCGNCGSMLGPRCTRCGSELPGLVRFCPTCGAPVSDAAALPEERKLVAVLFADVMGSTGLGERLDPEGLKEVMDAYFQAMRREIEASGGTVEKFIGDAVMSVFGVPVAHEDDADRSLRAALAMRIALEELNRSLMEVHGLALSMRIGISMGEVVAVTSPRPGEGMVTGDAVNIAARLEQSAEPGQIRVSERVARAAHGFELVEIGALQLRGKEEIVHAFELLRELPPGARAAPSFTAPMIGRDREMAFLQTVYERVAYERHPHLVTIYGDPGVGKSRLVREFAAWADRLESPPRIIRGRCLPYGEGVTYWPLAEILKGHADVLDSDPPRLALQKVELLGKEFLSPELSADPARATAALCLTVGLQHPSMALAELEPRQARVEISSAWRSYFSALAADRPTVAVIEDIHWADTALLDLLEELAERVQGPVLFLCPARPELTGRRPEWGGGRWNFSGILLEPLSMDDADRLIRFLLEDGQDLPPRIRTRILDRAGGNPFFLEEITRHIQEEPSTAASGDSEQSWMSGDVEIPDTVQGVLAARMDLLDQLEKRTLQSAAVVGRVFWTGPISRILGSEPAQIEQALLGLEDRGLVSTRLTSSLAGEREYIFKHILTRDVAYESLPRRDRAIAHAEVAAWMEATAGERQGEFIELLAHHYAEGFRLSREQARPDPDRTEGMRAKAYGYALEASRLARNRLALDTAQRMAEVALAVAREPVERSDALHALGETYFLSSQGDLAWTSLREAIDARLAEEVDGKNAAVAALCARALEIVTRGRGAMRARLREEEASPYLEIGLRHLADGDSEERVRLLTVQAFWPYSFRESTSTENESQRARASGERAADMAIRLGRADLASAALDGVVSYYQSHGLYGRMEEVVERRLQLVDDLGDPLEVGDVFAVAAWAAFQVGRYREATRLADEGVRRTIPGAQLMALYCLDFRAVARCRLGEWDAFWQDVALLGELLGERRDRPPGFASDHVAAAAFVHEVQGDQASAERMLRILSWLEAAEVRASPGWWVWKALLLSRRGEHAAARDLLARPEEGFGWGRGYRLEALCDVIAEQGSWSDAPGTLEEARRHSAEAGLLALPFYAERLEGLMMAARVELEPAVVLLGKAREGFSGLGARWESARTALSLADALLQTGRSDEAVAHLESCIPVLEELRSLKEVAKGRELLLLRRD